MTTVPMGRSTSARAARHDRRALNLNDYRLALILDDKFERISPNEDPPAAQALMSPDAKREIAPLLEIAVLLRFRGQTVRQSIATEQARTRPNPIGIDSLGRTGFKPPPPRPAGRSA